MFEKDMTIGVLLDFYGDVLSPHTQALLSRYYAEDLSLAEIDRYSVLRANLPGGCELKEEEKEHR